MEEWLIAAEVADAVASFFADRNIDAPYLHHWLHGAQHAHAGHVRRGSRPPNDDRDDWDAYDPRGTVATLLASERTHYSCLWPQSRREINPWLVGRWQRVGPTANAPALDLVDEPPRWHPLASAWRAAFRRPTTAQSRIDRCLRDLVAGRVPSRVFSSDPFEDYCLALLAGTQPAAADLVDGAVEVLRTAHDRFTTLTLFLLYRVATRREAMIPYLHLWRSSLRAVDAATAANDASYIPRQRARGCALSHDALLARLQSD